MKAKLISKTALSALMLISTTGFAGLGKDDYSKAMQQVEQLNFKKAANFFEEEMERNKEGSEKWIKSALGYAISLHRRQPDTESDKLEAAEFYTKVVKYAKASKSKYYPLALLQQGKLYEMVDYMDDQPDFENAYKCYDTIIKECPKSKLIHYAALCRGRVLIFQMKKDTVIKGIKELQKWLAEYPDNPFGPVQRTLIADASAYPLKDYKQAVATMKIIEKTGLTPGTLKDQFYWKLANYALKAGDLKTSREYLTRITALGNSRFGTVAKDQLKKIGAK